ncbi:hypothetical protein FHS13_001661 [Nocardiopsis algeriensis]|uniref:Uncharacterized protein n=1 Tax=Nocardiopsis algeriensis TaxID=1478215 RepID=A0A841INR9_9ACTN|nr:hypothetical protein [Nocardiopsis algeriensis]
MNQFTTSRALERLNTLLRQDGISTRTDYGGNTKRCILLALGRVEDVVRLVTVCGASHPRCDA